MMTLLKKIKTLFAEAQVRAYLVGLKLLVLAGDGYVKKLLLIPRI